MNVFSFCLYGPENPRYYPGMLENVYLAGKHFPSWKVYVYYAPDVTELMLSQLSACSNVVLRPTGILGAKNMIRRFFAIDEPGVDLMMVRDADSRIHWKDRWAIREFVNSPHIAHTIRDHKEHTSLMMGGLWGLKKVAGIHVETNYANYVEDISLGHRWAHDQNFLVDAIYPKVLPHLLVHYSHDLRMKKEHHATRFPFDWSNDVYCGRVESSYVDMPQPPPKRTPFFPGVPVRVSPPPIIPPPSYVSLQPSVQLLKFLKKK